MDRRVSSGGAGERSVTRDVEPHRVQDLLDRPPRATVAFVRDGEPELAPARARCEAGAYAFAVAAGAGAPLDGLEVVLVIDDGPYWFQLRGLSIRGRAAPLAPPPDGRADATWYRLEPRRVLAWDYGTIRGT
jgi:hypothetical protein